MTNADLTMQESLSCSICLELLKDPVAIPCGHSYCLSCIKSCWDKDRSGTYSCPQCRQTFRSRPVLNKNTILAELVDGLRKTRTQNAPRPDVSTSGDGHVDCDICSGTKHRAVKSCLVCLASYCETHIQSHYESAALKKHKLVEASGDLQYKICTKHDKLLEIFCHTDQQFICYFCVMDEHSGHKTVSTSAERTERQKQVDETMINYRDMIQKKEKEVCELQQDMADLCLSAQTATDANDRLFTDLIQRIRKHHSDVNGLVRAEEQAGLDLCKRRVEKLDRDIADLRKRNTELEKLSNTDDHVTFLQTCQSLCQPLERTSLSRPTSTKPFTEQLTELTARVRQQVEKFYDIELNEFEAGKICLTELNTRTDFLKYSCQLSLDRNTAHRQLSLSDDHRKVTVSHEIQNYPPHPERFDETQQVLCEQGLCGRHYWEVEQNFRINSTVAVAYKSIDRKSGGGSGSNFGCNDQSWSLRCFNSKYSFGHNNQTLDLPEASSRIGVYLDHPAGTLSFYDVSDAMKLIHTVHTTFTQPLYVGFEIYIFGNFIQICDLNVNEI